MKVMVSLPENDVRFLDDYVTEQGLDSRSAAMHRAVRLLWTAELGATYGVAWDEWAAEGEADRWESTSGDELGS